jgi:hypothetical protein
MSEQRRAKANDLLPGEARAAAGKPTHAFDSPAKVTAWLAANPARLWIAPHKYGGWGAFIAEVREGLHIVEGLDIVIELSTDANEGTKTLVRSLGRAMLEAGAKSVHCQGRRIHPDSYVAHDPRQASLFGNRR